jgi:2-polyprenyl-6-methoxyphenol hydroxylase-like FAD-dependent oxidoreductase
VRAGELNRADEDYHVAYERYERLMRPLVEQKQADARRFASAFAPKTARGVWVRNQVTKLLAVPVVGDRLLSRQFSDGFALPGYGI